MLRAASLLSALALAACYGPDDPGFGQDVTDLEGADDPVTDDDDAADDLGDDDDAASTDDDDALAELDDAEITGAQLPVALDCGEVFLATVEVMNVGTTTWTYEGNYKLGAVDDEDPLFLGVRVRLDEDDVVPPGETVRFEFELTAPDEEGSYLTDWRMVREAVTWFGESTSELVDVTCPVVDDGPDPPDLNTVTWLHSDISSWPVTSDLASVSISGGQICLEYDMADTWPIYDLDGTAVVGNPWIFIWEDEQWYGATWEWLRPGQTCKNAASVAGDHIKQYPFDAASGWTPTSGVTYYFMVSGLARFSQRNVEERTQLVPFVWP